MPAHRLFFALTPSPDLRARIEALAAGLPPARGRAIRPDKMHLTLAFLGDAEPARACIAGERTANATRAFDFVLDETDSFHGGTWVLRAPPSDFAPLLGALRRELQANGLRASDENRPFVPHLTLRRRADAPLPRAAIVPIQWNAHGLCLYDSDLATGVYTRLGEWPLAGGDHVSS